MTNLKENKKTAKRKVTTTLPKYMVEFCKANGINMSQTLNNALINDSDCKQEFVKVTLTVDADAKTVNKDCAYLLRKAISEIMDKEVE